MPPRPDATVDRAPNADDLGARLAFEALISDRSAALFAVSPEQIEPEVKRTLDRVRDFFHADRCALLRVSADQQAVHVRVASYAEGISRVPETLNLTEAFPWSYHRVIIERAPIRVSSISELPRDADVEREAWKRTPIRSALTLPIETEGIVSHLILLNTVHRECEWPDNHVVRLRVLGELLVGALKRAELFTGLHQREARLAAGADLAGLAFYEVNLVEGDMYVDERLREICGVPPELEQGLQVIEFWMEHLHLEDRPRVLELRQQMHDGRIERLSIEYRYLHPAGREIWIHHLAGASARDATGRALRTFGVFRDITERRQREEALRQSYEEIERLKDRLQAETDYLKAEIRVTHASGELTGRSAAILSVLRQVEQVAPTDSSVLIRGETGTGKELVAQAIHRLSPRRGHLLVKVNCAALPSGLVESELFGRERGAYTGALTRQVGRFEVADGSTIFLDEIGELSLDVQAKLLRVLESGEFERLGSPRTIKVNVRLVAATNRDLVQAIKQGRFREDLYYRLDVFPIRVPPLRDRPEDIPLLVWDFLEGFSARMGKKITQIPRGTMQALQRHSWPGNVRELRNVIEHGAIITTGDTLRLPILDAATPAAAKSLTLADAEREYILRALEKAGWRVKGPKGAASELGLKPATLYSRMKKLGIQPRGAGSASA
jgi:formate hydrogenlyase transcriptional activator